MTAPRPEPPSRFTVRLLRHRSSREWVVLLPGAGATTSVWFAQVRAFRRHFNLALVDFPGHHRKRRRGHRRETASDRPYSFDGLVAELGVALDRAGLARCHVVALSLGTILARVWAEREPERLKSAVLAGTIAGLTPVTGLLMRGGWYARRVMPYMMLYRLYAWIIMPGPSHHATRQLFYRDARLLGRREFNRWFSLSADVPALLRSLRRSPTTVPTLHVMGARDRMFLGSARRAADEAHASLHVIADAGHVCTVEAPGEFNAIALEFLRRHGAA
ncbi:MAG TPA: alpha/beta hydrolase [Vicinamibacterales bacterium]|nr:alpha/beta hydrolase [Vicinamibacterales bacterium]